jgi:hypothetical protein
VALTEGRENLTYPCEMNRLPPIMRRRKKGFEDPSRRKTNDLIPLESACLARESYKVTFLSQIGNGHEVPIGKYPECTGTSTLGIQEDVDKRISELCNKQAERSHFRAGYAGLGGR